MTRALLMVTGLFLIATSARAFETGRDMLAFATERHEFMLYVSGIMEGHMLTAAWLNQPQVACPDPETMRQQLAVAVLLWMADNPGHLNNMAPSVDQQVSLPRPVARMKDDHAV